MYLGLCPFVLIVHWNEIKPYNDKISFYFYILSLVITENCNETVECKCNRLRTVFKMSVIDVDLKICCVFWLAKVLLHT